VFLAKLFRHRGEHGEVLPRNRHEPIGILEQEITDVVDLGRIVADESQHALERQLDHFLALRNHVGKCSPSMQDVQRGQPVVTLSVIPGGQLVGGHSSTTSPGRKSGL
jgi:hypothetical protein